MSKLSANEESLSSLTDRARPDEAHAERVERLFREHNESLVRYLKTRLRSAEEAKEVAQEAYVQLLGLHHPDTVHFLQGFLFRTAGNLAKDRLKQRVRRHRADGLVFFESEESRSPERIVEARWDLWAMRRAVRKLPANCRMAFILVRFRGRSIEDAARTLNLRPQRVRRFVARATAYCLAELDANSSPGETP